jgi:hypothetical protein
MNHRTVALGFVALLVGAGASAQNTNGSGGQMPAFYDHEQLTINFKQLPPGGESATLTHNGSVNHIYMSDQCVAAGFMFISVIDSIQGGEEKHGGFNPLWNEVQIVFPSTADCTQFFSDTDIINASTPPGNTITLMPTTEVYRCSVVGSR